MTLPDRPITILIAALGGEGGGVMADWLIEAALRAPQAFLDDVVASVAPALPDPAGFVLPF